MNFDLLRNISIFSDLSDGELESIAGEMKRAEHGKGDTIFREGDPGEELFVVIQGSVSIFVIDPEGKEVALSEIGVGNFFGEMSIVEQAPRSATCRVLEDSVFLVLHADNFIRLIRSMPQAAVKILNRMLGITAGRLSNTGAFIAQMVQWGEESRKRAITDPATGLFNRRYLEESLDGLISRANIEGSCLSFAMFDLDKFSTLNARYGQEFCDNLIVISSGVFREVFAKGDILVRYGGDEFIFIFPGADAERALEKCNGLCAAMREMRFPGHDDLRLTCSIGCTTFPHYASNADELKEKSDKALYRAKEEGRDRALVCK